MPDVPSAEKRRDVSYEKIDAHRLVKNLVKVEYTPAVLHSVTQAVTSGVLQVKPEWVTRDAQTRENFCIAIDRKKSGVVGRPLPKALWRMSRGVLAAIKQDVVGVMLYPKGKPFTDAQIIRAMRDAGMLRRHDARPGTRSPDEQEARSGYNRDLMLGHVISFGKHSEKRSGRKNTIKDVIDNNPGYIKWALSKISKAFLHVTALRYYHEAGGEIPRKAREILAEYGNNDDGWKRVGQWLSRT